MVRQPAHHISEDGIRFSDTIEGKFVLQGDEDDFYHEKQLLPENFVEACKSVGMPVNFRLQPGYDHSYFFIATFVDDHIEHHIKSLQA
jgi:S-formylglutathione hydrolase